MSDENSLLDLHKYINLIRSKHFNKKYKNNNCYSLTLEIQYYKWHNTVVKLKVVPHTLHSN